MLTYQKHKILKTRSIITTNHPVSLFVHSPSSLSKGPSHTFFSCINKSTVDYIITDMSLAPVLSECQVHCHHPLNLSDHLPISLSLQLSSSTNQAF